MMHKNGTFRPSHSANHYESEGSGSSMTRWIDLNSASKNGFAVPIQLVPLLKLSSVERRTLVHRFTSDLERVRFLQKKVDSYKTKVVSAVTELSTNVPQRGLQPFSTNKGPGKKGRGGWNRNGGKAQGNNRVDPNAGLLKQCEPLLKKLMSHQYGWVFNTPVDVVKLNIPDYFDVIKNPMDLGTIKAKLGSGKYSSPLDFLADVRLTFTNAKTYNPPGTDVHVMADTLSQFFEIRWKVIEKKLVVDVSQSLTSVAHEDIEVIEVANMPIVQSKKRKTSPTRLVQEPIKRRITDEEKQKLSSELEELLEDLPENILLFLKAQSSNSGEDGEEEIEIDIDVLSDETLLTLRKLLDDHYKQKNLAKSEACEIELPNVPGLSNSSLQVEGENDPADEDVDIGNEAPVTSCPPIEIDKDGRGRTQECAEAASVSGLDQLDQNSQVKQYSSDSDGQQAGESEQAEKPVYADKMYREALLKNRFLDTILKAKEKTLSQDDKGDPEKLRREREELELHKKKEKARLLAEARAAEDARKRAEAEAAEEEKKRRELEREAAREALLKMEKTVEINETSRFLKDLEMLRAVPPEQLPSSMDETSPEPSLEGFGNFSFGGSNPLEQLGLYMKVDDEEEEGEPPSPNVPKAVDDVEEGQID